MQHKNILLCGFRATGKSTIGKKLAEKLNWNYLEMDYLIEQEAGMSIKDFTKGGTSWEEFRTLEQKILKECLKSENTVISAGGGVGVNNIVDPNSQKTFGELNMETINRSVTTLVILATASENEIENRIRKAEEEKFDIQRPILNEEKAKLVEEKLKEFGDNEQKRREFMIDSIVEDSMAMYKIRKPLYAKITNNIVDSGKLDLEGCVKRVVDLTHPFHPLSKIREGKPNFDLSK